MSLIRPKKEGIRLDNLFRKLYLDDCLTLSDIGKQFGITRQAVHDRLRRMGVKRRKKAPQYPPVPRTKGGGDINRKYSRRYELSISESAIVEMANTSDKYDKLYRVAKRARAKFSVQKLEDGLFKVTRVA